MSKCKNCKKYDDCRNGIGLTYPCGAYVPQCMTNADNIRCMNDECLAEFMRKTYTCPPAKPGNKSCILDCSKCWLEWIQQSSEEVVE